MAYQQSTPHFSIFYGDFHAVALSFISSTEASVFNQSVMFELNSSRKNGATLTRRPERRAKIANAANRAKNVSHKKAIFLDENIILNISVENYNQTLE